MTPTQFLAEINSRLDDSSNFAFSEAEKIRAISEGYKDSYSVKAVWDDSLTFDPDTYEYDIPDEIDGLKDIYTTASTDANPEPISSDFWEVIDRTIHLSAKAKYALRNGTTLFLKGTKRYADDETVEEVALQEYILAVASLRLYRSLTYKKLLKFVKNDTTVNEILIAKRDQETELAKTRQRLQRSFESA